MASPVPAKSQPLHNFSLPHLKWKNHRSGRSRLAGETSSSSPPHRSPSTPWRESPPPISHAHAHIPPHPPLRQSSPSYVSRRPSPLHKQSPMRESESESEPSCAFSKGIEKHSRKISSEKLTKSVDNSKGKRSNKICIRFRKNSNNIKHDDAVPEENYSSTPVDNAVPSVPAEEEESLPKIWNLRPRRPPMSHKQSNGGIPKIGSSSLPEHKTSHLTTPNKEASEVKNNDQKREQNGKKFAGYSSVQAENRKKMGEIKKEIELNSVRRRLEGVAEGLVRRLEGVSGGRNRRENRRWEKSS